MGSSGTEGVDSPMLKTSDANQNALTAFALAVFVTLYENCRLVIVTEENRVAMVDRLSRLLVLCSCANLIVGTPEAPELVGD